MQAKAQECAQRAKAARNPEAKRAYEDFARQWLDLAKRADEGAAANRWSSCASPDLDFA